LISIQAIVIRWRKGTPAEFWEEFSVDGKQMSYTAICTALTVERTEEAATIAKRARIDYGPDFEATFCYRKGGCRSVVMTDQRSIAKKAALLKAQGRYKSATDQ
jgi:hypothetical protein